MDGAAAAGQLAMHTHVAPPCRLQHAAGPAAILHGWQQQQLRTAAPRRLLAGRQSPQMQASRPCHLQNTADSGLLPFKAAAAQIYRAQARLLQGSCWCGGGKPPGRHRAAAAAAAGSLLAPPALSSACAAGSPTCPAQRPWGAAGAQGARTWSAGTPRITRPAHIRCLHRRQRAGADALAGIQVLDWACCRLAEPGAGLQAATGKTVTCKVCTSRLCLHMRCS